MHGTGLSLGAALIAVAVGLVVGSLLGLLAGFVRGWVDDALMRVVDVLLAIPALLLSLALVTALGFGTVKVAIAVGLAASPPARRVMRSEVLRVREGAYVEAAQAGGARRVRVLCRHVLPNSTGPVLVLATLEFGTAILAVSALSFLGYGAVPPTPEWGSLVAGGRDFLGTAWWLTAHARADRRADRARGQPHLPCPRWPGRCPMVSRTGTSTETLLRDHRSRGRLPQQAPSRGRRPAVSI